MQLTIRIDDTNFLTFDVKLQAVDSNQPAHGAEVISATVSDEQLSHIEADDLLDIAQQCIDAVTAPDSDSVSFDDDWRVAFRKGH